MFTVFTVIQAALGSNRWLDTGLVVLVAALPFIVAMVIFRKTFTFRGRYPFFVAISETQFGIPTMEWVARQWG